MAEAENQTRSRGNVLRTVRRSVPLVVLVGLAGVVAVTYDTELGLRPPVTPRTTPTPEAESGPGIPVYEDSKFTKQIGELTTWYSIICAFRRDPANPSIQPSNAEAYYVSFTENALAPTGFVDPQHAGFVTGHPPECVEPLPYGHNSVATAAPTPS